MQKLVIFLAAFSFSLVTTPSLAHQTKTDQLKAGFAQLNITPDAKQKVFTLGAGEQPIKAIHDPLYAKALYLTDGNNEIAIISTDVIAFFPPRQDKLSEQIKAISKVDQLWLINTHTHSGVLPFTAYQTLPQRLAALVSKAKDTVKPIKIGASQQSYDQGYNRILEVDGKAQMLWSNPQQQPTRAADINLGVINFLTLDNKPYITLVNYNVHPVITMNRFDAHVSADYPAAMAQQITQDYNSQVVFLPGAAGDINPFHAGIADNKDSDITPALKQAKQLGKHLAKQVIKQIANISNYQSKGKFEYRNINFPFEFKGNAQIKQQFSAQGVDVNKLSAQLNTLKLTNNIALAGFPGEYFSDFGKQLRQQCPIQQCFFLGYSNGNLGYVPTQKALALGGYGAEQNQLFFAPNLGHLQLNTVIKALRPRKP